MGRGIERLILKKIQALRGMNDLLPGNSAVWQYVESTVADVFGRYGYQEIRFPLLEQTELFKRSIGEVTDIVEKEMYTFDDRNGESITLRPEGTAACVRACEEHGLLYNQVQRLWYSGPMFRYERPQKGRLRQFHQFGVETFGMLGPDIDAELLIMSARLWRELGIEQAVTLQLNNLGTPEARARYRADLVAFLQQHQDALDEDSQRRLDTNPLRILDSKDQQTQQLLDGAPSLENYLDSDSREHFVRLQKLLTAAGVAFTINPRLVRGLDYYTDTVFEWVTDSLGAQGTVCAGGRYNGLVEQMGGKPTPAVGFGMGVERLVLLIQELGAVPPGLEQTAEAYVVAMDAVLPEALVLSEKLREALPHLRLISHCGGGSFKSQMKKADRSGADVALILGDEEAECGEVTLKFLRSDREQMRVAQTKAIEILKSL